MFAVMREPNAPPRSASVTVILIQSGLDGFGAGTPMTIALCTDFGRSTTAICCVDEMAAGFTVGAAPAGQPPNASRTAFSTDASSNTPLTYRCARLAV